MSTKKGSWSFGRILREFIVFALVLFVASSAMNYFRAPKLDSNKLPSMQVTLIDGNKFNINQYTGKPIMISFWGTWCPVCTQEASNIDSVGKKYTVLTIAVNSGNNENIKKWMQEKGVDHLVLNDASGIWAKKFKVSVFPTNFIYDSQGLLKFTETGYSTTAGLLARMKLAE